MKSRHVDLMSRRPNDITQLGKMMNDVFLSLLNPHISSDLTIIDKKKTLPPTGDHNTPKEHARESLLAV